MWGRESARARSRITARAGHSVQGTRVRNEGEGHLMFERKQLSRKATWAAAVAAIAGLAGLAPAKAADSVKIGLILPMTGGQASTGKQIENAIKLYMQQKGDTVAGKKIEIILKDDAAIPDKTKTAAQELIVNDKVNFIAGFGVTPAALAAAPLATQAKIPEVVMAAGTSIITERSPYIVRTSFTLAQSSTIIGDWAVKNGIKKVATLTSDYAPGNDALNFFKQHFTAGGGEVVEEVKVPLQNPDFAPFLQRMKDAKARRDLRIRAGGPGRQLHETVCRARPRQGRHQGDRARRRHRRRPAQQHGRCRARHRYRAPLFRGASLADEQGFRRSLQEGLRQPSGLHGRGRL
jgi:ABC-type branched-chain amino acid transport systems, periplasmic component